jgi:hypothetical protein
VTEPLVHIGDLVFIGPEAGQAEILPVPGIEHRHFRGPFAAVTYVRSWKESAACIAGQVQVVLLQMATASGKECDTRHRRNVRRKGRLLSVKETV